MKRCGVHRFAAITLAAIFFGSPLATCMAAPSQTNADMACCVTDQHDCMPGSEASNCCEKTAPQSAQQFLTSTLKPPVPQPTLVPVTMGEPLGAVPVASVPLLSNADSPPYLRGPIYLAVSAFRL